MRTLSTSLFSAAGRPGKSGGGYDEPKPDPKRGDDAEDLFHPEYEQGRELKKTSSEPDHDKPAHDEGSHRRE